MYFIDAEQYPRIVIIDLFVYLLSNKLRRLSGWVEFFIPIVLSSVRLLRLIDLLAQLDAHSSALDAAVRVE